MTGMTTGIIDLGDRELVFTIRNIAEKNAPTLNDIWKQNAPFSYEYLTKELRRLEIISKEGVWIYYPIRGNHPTCAAHVRGLYETLLTFNCVDELSFPEMRQIFNNTFRTTINNSNVLENKHRCHEEAAYFYKVFEAFANADTNAETTHTDE